MADPVETTATPPAAPHDGISDASAPAFTAPTEDVIETAPAAEVDDKKWKKALVVYGAAKIPTGETRPVIVAEGRYDVELDEKTGEVLHHADLVPDGYATKGDLYYRTDAGLDFGKIGAAPVLTLGDNIQQGGTWGFSPHPDFVSVGPAHPAYAAANIAYTRGAREIEIIGLSDAQKAHLQPWFDRLPTDPTAPAADVKIKLS